MSPTSQETKNPFFDLTTPHQKQKAALAIFGLMIILSSAWLGGWCVAILLSPSLALWGGVMFVMFIGGWMGYINVLTTAMVQNMVQQVEIKVTKDLEASDAKRPE